MLECPVRAHEHDRIFRSAPVNQVRYAYCAGLQYGNDGSFLQCVWSTAAAIGAQTDVFQSAILVDRHNLKYFGAQSWVNRHN